MKNEKCPTVLAHGRAAEMDGATYISTDDFNMQLGELQRDVMEKIAPKRAGVDQLAAVYAEIYSRTDASSFQRRAATTAQCGTFLEYRVSAQGRRLAGANFCRDRLCPMCAWRRSLKIFAQVSRVMDALQQSDSYDFLFLTLTIRNRPGGDLPDAVQQLYDGWRKLYHKNAVFRQQVCGTFRALECTRNQQTGEYHPHLHVILAVRPSYWAGRNYIPQRGWARMWQAVCGLDYCPIVDVRRIKPGSRGLAGAVAEVAKYSVKSQDYLHGTMDEQVAGVLDYLVALSGRRLCSFTGCFADVRRQLRIDDDPVDGDLLDVDGSGLRDDVAYMVVRYRWQAGVYVRDVSPRKK